MRAAPRTSVARRAPTGVPASPGTVVGPTSSPRQRYERALHSRSRRPRPRPSATTCSSSAATTPRQQPRDGARIRRSAWTRGPSLPVAVNHPGGRRSTATSSWRAASRPPARPVVPSSSRRDRRAGAEPRRCTGRVARCRSSRSAIACMRSADVTEPSRLPFPTYDPRTETWTDIAPIPVPRNHVAGYTAGTSRASRAAGRRARVPLSTASIPPPARGTTTECSRSRPPAPPPRSDGATVVAGGEPGDETRLVTVVQRRSASNAWTTEPMLVPRHGTAFAVYRGRLGRAAEPPRRVSRPSPRPAPRSRDSGTRRSRSGDSSLAPRG